jgi:hypothetical protein
MGTKWLELLKQIAPGLARTAVLEVIEIAAVHVYTAHAQVRTWHIASLRYRRLPDYCCRTPWAERRN